MNKRALGSKYEEYSVRYLKSLGYNIIAVNFRNRFGEIDIIAENNTDINKTISFVEVKYRSSDSYGSASEAVNKRKQQTIRKVAQYFLLTNQRYAASICSFDVIAIDNNKINFIKNAF